MSSSYVIFSSSELLWGWAFCNFTSLTTRARARRCGRSQRKSKGHSLFTETARVARPAPDRARQRVWVSTGTGLGLTTPKRGVRASSCAASTQPVMQKAPPTGEPAADPSSTHDDDNDDSSSSDWDDPDPRPPHQRRSHPPPHKRVCTRDASYVLFISDRLRHPRQLGRVLPQRLRQRRVVALVGARMRAERAVARELVVLPAAGRARVGRAEHDDPGAVVD